MQLRPYQVDGDAQIEAAWAAGFRNVLFVLCCGGGKTAILSNRIEKHNGASVAIAHRQELVSQMSLTLARYGVKHRIISPTNVVRSIIQMQIAEYGRDFYDPSAKCAVAGVDTLVSWSKPDSKQYHAFMRWAQQVTLWITDEAHHLIGNGSGSGNKWGKAVSLFPNAKGLGVTATPERSDGKGLGRCSDGLFDTMLLGPGMRDLINGMPDHQGVPTPYLTDYRIFCPPSDLDLTDVATGADGDFIRAQLAQKTRKSTVMGHVVEHYLRIAPGKLGVTFSPDIETAIEFSRLFNEAGVPSEVLSSKTPNNVRLEILRRFKNRQVLQLVTVDIVSEGFDLPAIEVVSMARATQSYGLFVQQFGRGCRLLEGKKVSLIIDHVGNVIRHGLPDRSKDWTLERRERSAKKEKDPNIIPMRICCNPLCMSPYERIEISCPFCGWTPVPTGRTSPEMVDGDLCELLPEVLAAMRGEVAKVDRHPDEIRNAMERAGNPPVVFHGAAKQHAARQEAQQSLRQIMMWYGGLQHSIGRDTRTAQRAFFHQFGVDIVSAQSLGRPEADNLRERITSVLIKNGVTI